MLKALYETAISIKPCFAEAILDDGVGHEVQVRGDLTEGDAWVRCSCGAAGPTMNTVHDAITAWNRVPRLKVPKESAARKKLSD